MGGNPAHTKMLGWGKVGLISVFKPKQQGPRSSLSARGEEGMRVHSPGVGPSRVDPGKAGRTGVAAGDGQVPRGPQAGVGLGLFSHRRGGPKRLCSEPDVWVPEGHQGSGVPRGCGCRVLGRDAVVGAGLGSCDVGVMHSPASPAPLLGSWGRIHPCLYAGPGCIFQVWRCWVAPPRRAVCSRGRCSPTWSPFSTEIQACRGLPVSPKMKIAFLFLCCSGVIWGVH